jgi:proprotein convertase subtilisin/kexin type 5
MVITSERSYGEQYIVYLKLNASSLPDCEVSLSDNAADGCLICKPGFKLKVDKTCVSTCPVGEINTSLDQCFTCPSNCAVCKSVSICKTCDVNYVVQTGGSCAQCASNQFYQALPSPPRCTNCHAHCKTCSGPLETDCITCHNDIEYKDLNDNKCKGNCVLSYKNTAAETCHPCSTNCLDCTTDANTCSECDQMGTNKFLQSGVCKSECDPGFYPGPGTGETVRLDLVSTPTAKSIVNFCIQCHGDCETCTAGTATDCIQCANGKYLKGVDCVSNCGYGKF